MCILEKGSLAVDLAEGRTHSGEGKRQRGGRTRVLVQEQCPVQCGAEAGKEVGAWGTREEPAPSTFREAGHPSGNRAALGPPPLVCFHGWWSATSAAVPSLRKVTRSTDRTTSPTRFLGVPVARTSRAGPMTHIVYETAVRVCSWTAVFFHSDICACYESLSTPEQASF